MFFITRAPQKYDTSFKAALDSIIKTVSTLPSDKIYQQD
jgi:hypothetical protein